MRYTFKAYERLKREQHIDTLFHTGKAYSVLPIRVIYLAVPRPPAAAPVQAGFSVPKKKFRSSVHRHRVRRLMVEAWRLHKHQVYEQVPPTWQLHVFLIFTAADMPDYTIVHDAVVKGIEQLTAIAGKLSHASDSH